MPIYEYRCDSCGAQKEHLQKMSDPQLTTCPAAARKVTASCCQPLASAQGQRLYATDFKGGSKPADSTHPARAGREHALRAGPIDQTLLHLRATHLGPPGYTGWVLSTHCQRTRPVTALLPESIHPQHLFGFAIPGAGALLTLGMILLTGLLAANSSGKN